MRYLRNLSLCAAVAVVVCTGLFVAGCESTAPTTSETTTSEFINDRCPIMDKTIDPAKVPASLTREFNGQKVAFCCAGCPGQWDALSDEEKVAKLAEIGAELKCTGQPDCKCAHCAVEEVVQCTGRPDCTCAHCAVEEVVQCTGQPDCKCAHCAVEEVVQCTGQPGCPCSHCSQ